MKVKQGLLIVTLAATVIAAVADVLPLPLRLLAIVSASLPVFLLSQEHKEIPIEAIKMDELDLQIIHAINGGADTVNTISKKLGVGWGTVKRHLNKLSDLGLVETIKGQEIRFSLTVRGKEFVKLLPSTFVETPIYESVEASTLS